MAKVTNNSEKVLEGFIATCEAVGMSMGYNGGFALMQNSLIDMPSISKDGITIARSVTFKDKQKNMGAMLAKQASARTLANSGDSTSTTLVLAKYMLQNTSHFNPKVLEGINIACAEVEDKLAKLAKPVDEDAIKAIATISANNNKELGDILLKAYQATGREGVIDVSQDFDSTITKLRVSNGMRLDKGWKSPFLITNEETAVFEAENVSVLIYEGHITPLNAAEVADALKKQMDKVKETQEVANFIIFCERIADDTVLNLVDRHQVIRNFNITVVESPLYDNMRKAIMADVALYTNGTVYVQGTTETISFGLADKVIVDANSCTFIQKEVSQEVKDKVVQLKMQLETTPEKEFIQKRITGLEGVAATIVVGAQTPVENTEKFHRVEDSICAVRSSLAEGWVAGGGTAFSYIAGKMKKKFANEEIQFGYDSLKKTLDSILIQICENSSVEYNQYLESSKKKYGMGYNAAKNKQSNLIKDNVIDSAKSLRIALENSKSVVNMLLNVKVVINS